MRLSILLAVHISVLGTEIWELPTSCSPLIVTELHLKVKTESHALKQQIKNLAFVSNAVCGDLDSFLA